MSVLNNRLLRNIKNTRGQFLSLASIVMIGVLIYISVSTMYANLARSQQVFYAENQFADYYFHLVKAPRQVTTEIENIPGVAKVSGRIVQDVPIIKDSGKRASARLYSYNSPLKQDLNQLHLYTGQLFSPYEAQSNEALIDPSYYKANKMSLGNSLTISSEGKKYFLNIIGTATSPEFIYPIKDGSSLFPEPEDFGIIMMPYKDTEQIFNMPGQINQVIMTFTPGINQDAVVASIKEHLKPYGLVSSYPRKNQLSHAMIQGELDQLKLASLYMPLMFFFIAAFIQFVLLSRLIKQQRGQIGVMKALGLSSWQIGGHYTSYSLAVSFVGCIAGILLGIVAAGMFSDLYAQFFNLPQSISGLNPTVIIHSILLTGFIGASAGILASRGIIRINPAESMRPEPPRQGNKIFLEKWTFLWQRLNSNWKMNLRALSRNRSRFIISILGIAASTSLLIIAFFMQDSTNYMLDRYFNQEKKYDYIISFTGPIKENDILYWSDWEEVISLEPILNIPVKIQTLDCNSNILKSEQDTLQGLKSLGGIKTAFDTNKNLLELPLEGMLINIKTAEKLGVQIGDIVLVETMPGMGPEQQTKIKIIGINEQLFGGSSLISLKNAQRLLQETNIINAVMLQVEAKYDHINERLQDIPRVASILSKNKEKANIMNMMDSMHFFIITMVFFAGILGLAIVYNGFIINLNERSLELATLKVVGYTNNEIKRLLAQETALQAILGITIGLPGGYWLGKAYLLAASSDMFSIPAVIYPRTYLIATLLTIIFVLLGFTTASRKLSNLDITTALKNKD